MRSSIGKGQLAYLVRLLTLHIEGLPDDIGKWVQCLKIAYKELVTLDNMGIDVLDHSATVITLDRIYKDLKNNYQRNSIDFPMDSRYFK